TAVLVADVDVEAVPAELVALRHPNAGVLLQLLQHGRVDRVEYLDVACPQRGRRSRTGDWLEDDLVEEDVFLVVVVGRLDQGDVVAGYAVVEHERADADRFRPEVVAELRQLGRGEDVGIAGERRVPRLHVVDDRVGPRRADAVDGRETALP